MELAIQKISDANNLFACVGLPSTLNQLHVLCYISVAAPVNGTQSHLGVTKVATLITPIKLHWAESDHVSVFVDAPYVDV